MPETPTVADMFAHLPQQKRRERFGVRQRTEAAGGLAWGPRERPLSLRAGAATTAAAAMGHAVSCSAEPGCGGLGPEQGEQDLTPCHAVRVTKKQWRVDTCFHVASRS